MFHEALVLGDDLLEYGFVIINSGTVASMPPLATYTGACVHTCAEVQCVAIYDCH